MASDIDIVGLESLARLSRALREAGDQGKGLKRELRKGLNAETKQTRKEMRKAIGPALPKHGGLAADVLRSTRFTTTVATGSNPGVSIKARGKRSIRRMNATGNFRHPVFGRPDKTRKQWTWVAQRPTVALKHFLDRPFVAAKPDLERAVNQAIARTQDDITRSIR